MVPVGVLAEGMPGPHTITWAGQLVNRHAAGADWVIQSLPAFQHHVSCPLSQPRILRDIQIINFVIKNSCNTSKTFPTGPYMCAIIPVGNVTDWNLRAWTRWFSPGLQMGLTVPSINPKQLSSAAPLFLVASAYICSFGGSNSSWFHSVMPWLCCS